jgi:hypothetical protein
LLFLKKILIVGMIGGIAALSVLWGLLSGNNLNFSQVKTEHCSGEVSYFPLKSRNEAFAQYDFPTPEQIEADPTLKFESGFYDKVLCLINYGETRSYSVIIIVADKNKDLLVEKLKAELGATNVVKGQSLSFVGASIPIKNIPKLASYDYVIMIGDGESKLHPT